MKQVHLLSVFFCLIVCLGACRPQPEYCTVKGSVKGLKDGTRLELQDEYDFFKIIATTRVKDGAYEFHPRISEPTHVYLYTHAGEQLKDFLLEPGTIVSDVDATNEDDYAGYATGTGSNDMLQKIHQLDKSGDSEAADALRDEIINAEETGILALYLADNRGPTALQGLGILDRLSGELAAKPYVARLRDVLTRRSRTEPAPEGSDSPNCFIDMEFPDIDGKPVSLSSVVNDPANRYVLLDFWATWCSPCRESIPKLQALYEKYHDKGLEIYSVSEDANEKNWKAFIPESGMTWVNVHDVNAANKDSSMWHEYALFGIPTVLLIDGETGAIIFRDRQKDIEDALASLLQ